MVQWNITSDWINVANSDRMSHKLPAGAIYSLTHGLQSKKLQELTCITASADHFVIVQKICVRQWVYFFVFHRFPQPYLCESSSDVPSDSWFIRFAVLSLNLKASSICVLFILILSQIHWGMLSMPAIDCLTSKDTLCFNEVHPDFWRSSFSSPLLLQPRFLAGLLFFKVHFLKFNAT